MAFRFFRGATVVVCALFASGCSSDFPNFSWSIINGRHTYDIPAATVALQIRCELSDFFTQRADMKSAPGKIFLKREADAKVLLTLKSDVVGSIDYFGIDLKKIGLDRLAAFFKPTKDNLPGLSAGVETKSTVTVEVNMEVKQGPTEECTKFNDDPLYNPKKLFLAEWLSNFFEGVNSGTFPSDAKIGEVKLTSNFVLVADVSAGAIYPVFGGSLYILPINDVGGSLKSERVHSLAITLKTDSDDGVKAASKKEGDMKRDLERIGGLGPRILLREMLVQMKYPKP